VRAERAAVRPNDYSALADIDVTDAFRRRRHVSVLASATSHDFACERTSMGRPSPSGGSEGASDIRLVDVTTGQPFPSAPAGCVLLSSAPLNWRGILVEWQRLEPQELPEHYVVGHGMSVSTGKQPIAFGWRDGKRSRDGRVNPGEFHLLTHGELNTPRWLQTFEEVSLVLEPQFVADLVRDGLPAERVEFVTQRSASDATIVRYTEAFRCELESDSPNGRLYADTLTVGFTLHLLSTYAVAKPKIPLPRGKLTAVQLRAVVDFIQSHVADDVSLAVLADQANASPFHFARQFRATVGMPPHQYVLRQRVQKSLRLINARQLPLAQIAVESGFHDQPHFIRAFRKILGMTPTVYSGRRSLRID
jgi:AraC family transcriptional regulator